VYFCVCVCVFVATCTVCWIGNGQISLPHTADEQAVPTQVMVVRLTVCACVCEYVCVYFCVCVCVSVATCTVCWIGNGGFPLPHTADEQAVHTQVIVVCLTVCACVCEYVCTFVCVFVYSWLPALCVGQGMDKFLSHTQQTSKLCLRKLW